MDCTIKLTEDMFWVGGNDRRLALFENVHPVPKGMSYNSYIVKDEKTVLLDTVDKSVSERFFENIEAALEGRSLDYLIVNHMEPDHSWAMNELIRIYPDIKIVCNSKIVTMIKQYFDFDIESRAVVVKEGETLETGKHTFKFFMAPMVHWPEVMVTYDITDKVLYSADAFGTFGALNGNIFADELNIECDILSEARRYYTNIVGKYGNQVQALLKKAEGLEISLLCPLHGPVWRRNISWFVDKYAKWSTYTPEDTAVMIAYASVYGNTENAAEILAVSLAKEGVKNISMFDVSVTHPSYIVSEAFRCSHLVFVSTTYNAEIFCNMQTLLHDIKSHNLQNRTVAFMENGSWAPTAGGLMRCMVSEMKNMQLIEETVSIKSSLKRNQLAEIDTLVAAIMASMPKPAAPLAAPSSSKVEIGTMFKLSYGLFVLTAKEGKKDNGCIINTAIQVTDNPKRISIAVNKANYTHDMILNTGAFNVSILTTETPFSTFQHFGFQSGRSVEKFADGSSEFRSENGVVYLPKYTNAYISGKVISTADYGTHTIFVAEVTEAKVLSNEPSVTYQYYADNIKPKPKASPEKKKGFICTVCGYIYEGDELPKDFICPICKHGAEVFEPLK
ncbi:MAG: flavin reductase [Lachnospiraceae bacterium]|nr:flavin reductase [Lachnospiraceae bacterium]